MLWGNPYQKVWCLSCEDNGEKRVCTIYNKDKIYRALFSPLHDFGDMCIKLTGVTGTKCILVLVTDNFRTCNFCKKLKAVKRIS